jgi:DNA-binding transcriptional MerR regulator
MEGAGSGHDPLINLREYRQLAPWSLRDLTALTGAILEAAGVRPINAAAAARPSERTVRFYVTRHLVAPPEGRGTAATYSYRHLLQVLAIKLRQMEGATLERIAEELEVTTGDVLERRIAAALGPGLPPPHVLPLGHDESQPTGRAGRVFRSRVEPDGTEAPVTATWRRLLVTDGVELHVRDDHPVAASAELERQVSHAVRLALGRLVAPRSESTETPPGTNSPQTDGYH